MTDLAVPVNRGQQAQVKIGNPHNQGKFHVLNNQAMAGEQDGNR